MALCLLASCVNKNASYTSPERTILLKYIDSVLNDLKLTNAQKNRLLLDKGYHYYYNGKVDHSAQVFDLCYALDSSKLENQYAFALVNSTTGHHKKSLRIFDKIIQKDSLAKISAYGSKAMLYEFMDEGQKAQKMVSKMLVSNQNRIRREAHSVSAVLALMKDSLSRAISHLRFMIPYSINQYTETSHRLEHPYWDYHLIANIFLDLHMPDSAKYYSDKGFALLGPYEQERTVRVIQEDRDYFKSLYFLKKGQYDDCYYKLMEGFEKNQNGLGSIWARLLIEKNMPDSALVVLDTYCRGGYFTDFIKGQALLHKGDTTKANEIFEEVLSYHQVGEWYWQHEYALTCSYIRRNIYR